MKDTQRVLVVDDEASIRRQLSVGLAQRGYEVEDCEKGLSALERIEAAQRSGFPHDYVVLDIRLPDIDGLQLLRVIKDAYPDLPVVMISGYGDERTVEMVKERQGSAYLDKPFELERLEAEIERIGVREPVVISSRKEVEPEVRLTQSAYVFLRGKTDADLSKCFSRLYYAAGVCYCDAVMGDWDIVLLVQAPDRKGIQEFIRSTVKPLQEIEKFEVRYSERPLLGRDLESFIRTYERMQVIGGEGDEVADKRKRQLLSAYALLEIEKSGLAPLYVKYYFDENVVYCDMTDECTVAVLLIQGRTFDEMRQAIARLQSWPGVLRAKTLHIMKFMGL